jgi:hypothetical protein
VRKRIETRKVPRHIHGPPASAMPPGFMGLGAALLALREAALRQGTCTIRMVPRVR